jgi:hypothetical protein
MPEINSGPSLDAQIYAMKKAVDIQKRDTLNVLENIGNVVQQTQSSVKTAELTGKGMNLDVKS